MSVGIEKSASLEQSHTRDEEAQRMETIDTVHNDEAVKVLATYHGEETWDNTEEKRLRRKIDWKLMPVLCLTYGLQYYDKAMLSQAVREISDLGLTILTTIEQALFGLREDLGLLTGTRYSYTAAIFYLGFVLGIYPTMLLAQRFPVERVASATVTLWGICLILTTVCTNYKGIYAQRFFLGALESGINPMFMLIVVSAEHHNPLVVPWLTKKRGRSIAKMNNPCAWEFGIAALAMFPFFLR